jgi:hypothetical protein
MKSSASGNDTPRGLTAMGIFLAFGVCMALLAGITLSCPGTPLDRAWRLNPEAYGPLRLLGRAGGFLFFGLALVLELAAAGWFRRRRWGWLLATVLIAFQIQPD